MIPSAKPLLDWLKLPIKQYGIAMPVHTSGNHNGHACSIIGSYAQGGVEVEAAVSHVGLLVAEMVVKVGEDRDVSVYHMGPPLGQGFTKLDIMASLAGLSPTTIRKMEQWALDMFRSEQKIYYVLPASLIIASDAPNDPPTRVKFSCAGFVERCYRDVAKLQLVVNENALPKVSLATLTSVWVDQRASLSVARVRGRAGLVGDGPWPVLMPAYLFHAIQHIDKHGRDAAPYQPVDGDWQFRPSTAHESSG